MYIEVYSKGKLIHRIKEVLGGFSFSNELMYVPSLSLTLPITYRELFHGREEVKVFVNGKVFWGIVLKITENKEDETIDLGMEHVIREWTYRQISVNNAVKDKRINVIFKGSETATNGNVTVSANPFDLIKGEKLTDAQYISRAGAVAWNTSGDKVSVSVDASAVKAEAGSYKVKFSAGGATVTVDATVKDDKKEVSTDVTTEASVVDQLGDIYADTNFAYPGWRMNYEGGAASRTIDYVYSRQNKLEALTKTMELTPDLFWRVRFVNEKVVDISTFGEQKQWIISLKPSGANNIRIIEEPTIEHDFENVINLATVYSEKSDSGMSSMTLREVYNDTTLQIEGFPCVILRSNVNNERNYKAYTTQYPKLAPNNELEYAVIDVESVAMESGHLIEGTYAFNDLSPFTPDADGKTQEISDADRIKAATTAYHAAVKKLKDARRRYKLTLTTEELPVDIAPGDKVRLLYDNSLYILDECSAYTQKILSYNDWFYVTAIDYDIDETGTETNSLTLEKYLHIDRETDNQ